MFIQKGSWRYVVTQCLDCKKEKEVRIDSWNRVKQQWRCLSCAVKNTFKTNPELSKQIGLKNQTHGESRNKNKRGHWLYTRWQKMKKRCKESPTYIQKNIQVCEEWRKSYEKFKAWSELNGADPKLELDRINNKGNYEPSNCRWITHQQNCANR
jgi:hypothetical protein